MCVRKRNLRARCRATHELFLGLESHYFSQASDLSEGCEGTRKLGLSNTIVFATSEIL